MPSLLSQNASGSKRKRYAALMIFSFIAALLFQLICSKNSPLYPMNDWVDVHCFFTVGKSALRGKVLYRDIYEQKGPILYFIYAAIALISDTSFIGAFIVHVIAMTLFLYFSARIVLLLTENSISAYFTIPILAFITHTADAFAHGGSTEELCLWMLSATLYIMVRNIKANSALKGWEALVIGLFAGFVLYVKFTFLGFFFGIALLVLIWHIHIRRFKRLFVSIGAFLGGIALVSVPVFAYFGINHAIPDFIQAYFYNNIFVYGSTYGSFALGIVDRTMSICFATVMAARQNPLFFIAILAGILRLLFKKPFNLYMLLTVLLSAMFLAIGAFWGKYIKYYCFILAPFAVFGFCWMKFKPRFIAKLMVGVITVCGLALSFFVSDNTYLMRYEKEELPQYRFAKQINEVENASMHYYGFLDGGFYHAANIEPSGRFFCKLNIPLPEMKEEQDALIENGIVDFVVSFNLEIDSPNYVCIDTCEFPFESFNPDPVYRLYKNVNLM